MAYYTGEELENLRFANLGKNVKISVDARIYDADRIEIGDNSRIDDFCVLSGKIRIGSNVHVAPFCLIAGGVEGVWIEDFAGLAYGVKVFSQSDDYSGRTMTNPTIPGRFKAETRKPVTIGRHSIIGAGSIIMPGVNLGEGTAVGAMSLVRKSTEPWSIYVGNPAKKIRSRSQELLELERRFLAERT